MWTPGKLLANNLKELSFEDEDLAEYGNYVYEVTARTDTALGGTAVSDGILIGSGTSLPIIEGWEDPHPPRRPNSGASQSSITRHASASCSTLRLRKQQLYRLELYLHGS